MAHEHKHHVNYFYIFLALCVLTALSVVTDVIEFESKLALAFIVLAVATAKALFVMMYFMHLKFEGNWKYLLLAPTIILAMAIPAALGPDIGMHYYTLQVPQAAEAQHLQEHGSDSHSEHEETDH